MTLGRCVLAICVLLFPALAQAQDFGVMESAETINRGITKLKVNPMLIFGDGDSVGGVAAGAGYGFTDRFDAEAKVAFYNHVMAFGGDAEYWLVKGRHPVDLSLIGGFHYVKSDFVNETGVDVTVLGSHAATKKLDVYAALDMAFNKYRANFPDNNYTRVHLVPGIEYRIHKNLDLLAELGIALNRDNGRHYISGGLAYYLR